MGAPGLLARAILARFSKTVVAQMAAEKGATSCLLSALGPSLRTTENGPQGQNCAVLRVVLRWFSAPED